MENRKILFLIPSMNGGGAEKVTLLLGNELVKLGWNVAFAMSKIEGPYLNKIDDKIRIIKLPYRKISRNVFAIRSVLQRENPDIFYTSMEYVNIIGGIAHKLSKSSPRLIYSEHNNIEKTLNRYRFGPKAILKSGIKYTYPLADHIVCVSDGVKTALQKSFQNLKNISVIYNPIEQMEPKTNLTHRNTPYRILSIGRLNKQKNHILLLQAYKYLIENYSINAYLTIIGEGEERSALEDFIRKHNLSDKVDLPGFQNPNTYLNNSDLFVLSSSYEGFGNVIVEALSTGIQVVSTDCPSGPAEILEHGKYGDLVPVNDMKALAQSIFNTYNESPDVNKAKARIERAKDFAPTETTQEYQKLFYTLLVDNQIK